MAGEQGIFARFAGKEQDDAMSDAHSGKTVRARLVPSGWSSSRPWARNQHGAAAKRHAIGYGSRAPFAGTAADQVMLELGKPARNRQNEPPVGGRGVRPMVSR